MTDVQVHFRGQGSESRRLPALPRRGDFLDHDGKPFSISAMVFAEAVNAYTVPASYTLAGELRQRWATWGESPTSPKTNEIQQGLF